MLLRIGGLGKVCFLCTGVQLADSVVGEIWLFLKAVRIKYFNM